MDDHGAPCPDGLQQGVGRRGGDGRSAPHSRVPEGVGGGQYQARGGHQEGQIGQGRHGESL